ENGPCDRSASFCRSIPPTLHQMQECSWIGIQFLQWSPFNSRNNAGGQPARLTQLDYDHQRADLFEGNQRTAQVINLDHGAPLSAFAQRQRCQTFVAVPIVSGPFAALQDRPDERAVSARKRSSAEGAGCANCGPSKTTKAKAIKTEAIMISRVR